MFFLDEFMSETNKTYLQEKNMIVAKDGSKFVTKIIKEDVFYNNEFKSYSVWTIEHLLIENFAKYISTDSLGENPIDLKPPTLMTLTEKTDFLVGISPVLYQTLEKYISDFNSSYILLDGYLPEAIQKIKYYYKELLEDFILFDPKFKDLAWNILLKNCIHSLLLVGIFKKIFTFYEKLYRKDDLIFSYSLSKLTNITWEDLGVPKSFQKDQSRAIQMISTMNSLHDLYGKLNCIKLAIDLIMEDLDKTPQNMFQEKEKKHVTSDELLPIMTWCLIHSVGSDFISNLHFMTDFLIPDISSSEIGYALVTFEAAIETVKREAEKIGISEDFVLPNDFEGNKTVVKNTIDRSPRLVPMELKKSVSSTIKKEPKKETIEPIVLTRSISVKATKQDEPKRSAFLMDLMKSDDEVSDPDTD
jgi:hypothetical protein